MKPWRTTMYRIGNSEVTAVREAIKSGRLFRYANMTGAKEQSRVEAFESGWEKFTGSAHCLSTTSGTSSLICSLTALGIGPGDEVIVPGYTYIATALAVLKAGAIPVIAEIDESCTLDPKSLAELAGPRTKAVIPVHMMGMPCDMDSILRVSREKNLYVLEDACQAAGGTYKGKILGTLGDMGVFSFNFYKIIASGEGGALITNNRKLYERAFMEHDGGGALWPDNDDIKAPFFAGGNSRNSEISGAILLEQLKRLPGILSDLRMVHRTLSGLLEPAGPVHIAPSRDTEGDCGIQTTLLTDDTVSMRKLLNLLGEAGVEADSPVDSDRHLFYNWDPILSQRGAAHPLMNPYKMPANAECRLDYPEDMLPRTRDIVSRTIMIRHNIDWSEKDVMKTAEKINRCIQKAAAS